MVELNTALSQMLLQQQVSLSVMNKVMDFQENSGEAIVEAMTNMTQAQDPIRGNLVDVSV